MMRRRAVLALSALVGVIILVLAWSGIESSRENMLELIAQEGETMMQALVTSAGNNLAASAIVEQAGIDRLVEVANLLGRVVNLGGVSDDSLAAWQERFGFERIDLVDDLRRVKSSSWGEVIGGNIRALPNQLTALDSVLAGQTDLAIAAPLPSALPRDDYVSVAVRTGSGVLMITAPARKLIDYQESLGIGFIVRQMGGEAAIDYAVLQNDSGIVLASRNIGPLPAIAADDFLQEALTHVEIVHRLFQFEDKEVLEVVRSFKSDVMPSGILRLGMSLEVYHQLYADSLKQLGILSLVLFALGVVGAYAATYSKKLAVTAGSLEQLRSLTDEIIQSLEAAVIATDKDGRISVFNPQSERIFAKSARAVIGQPYSEVFADDLLALTRISGDITERFHGEVVYSGNAAGRRHLLVSSTALMVTAGAYAGAVSLVYDLTDQKQLEESARAAERLSELGTLAAGVAHEIRNPLNAIAIAAQRLKIEFSPAENVDDYAAFLKTISSEVERLNAIIKDFLALARGKRLNKVLVDLDEFLNDIAAQSRLEAGPRGVEIAVNAPAGVSAEIDRAEMKQVLLNLVRNALQAIDGAGVISITASAVAARGRAQIDVSNSGAKIPLDNRERIFQPYFSTRADGTGLGLAICRRIVGDHGGTIELLEGEPTTFRIVV